MGAPQCTLPGLGGRVGVLAFGPSRGALRSSGARRAFSAPFRLSARQGGARALATLFRQKQCTRRSSCVPDARVDCLRQERQRRLCWRMADHPERSDRDVQIVPPLLLQFPVRVKRLRIRIHSMPAPAQSFPAQCDRQARHDGTAPMRTRTPTTGHTPTITAALAVCDNIELLGSPGAVACARKSEITKCCRCLWRSYDAKSIGRRPTW